MGSDCQVLLFVEKPETLMFLDFALKEIRGEFVRRSRAHG